MENKFLRARQLLEEGKEKHFFNEAALYIGDRKGEVFKYFIQSDEKQLYDMASMTKIMTTTMIALKFIEEGRLCLWDTLGTFFEVPKDKQSITIMDLMTHTAGFEPFFDIEKEAHESGRVLEIILKRPLYGEIGKEVYYSCIGYIVLGEILEKVGEDSLDVLTQRYVCQPLGLEHTTHHPVGGHIAATEYNQALGGHLKGIVHDENARFLGLAGNAGLFSNLQDVTNFGSMLASGGMYQGKPYLSSKMFERAISSYTPQMNEARGLGFSLFDGRLHASGDLFSLGSFGHTGFTGTSLFVDSQTGMYVVLLTNRVFYGREDTGFFRMRRQLHNSIVSEYSKNNL